MAVIVPARSVAAERLQLDPGDPGGTIEPGLALHAERLKRVRVRRPADQEIAAATDADRRVGAEATVIAGEIAAADAAVRRIHRPGQLSLRGDAEIEAIAAHGRDVGFGTPPLALEHAFEAGHRADHEADILAALTLQDAGANRRPRVGGTPWSHSRRSHRGHE